MIPRKTIQTLFNRDVILTVVTIVFLVTTNSIAMGNRAALILYYLVAVGSAFVLVKRNALAYASAICTFIAATMFVEVYYAAQPGEWAPPLRWAIDTAGLISLMYLTARIVLACYKVQRDEEDRRIHEKVQEKIVALRADALRQTSHEVRTPLSTITAISETLLDGTAGQLTSDQSMLVHDIDDAAQHLMALVNDVLDYAKAEAGMLQLNPKLVSMNEVVNQSVSLVAPRATHNQVTVTAIVDPDVPEVFVDPLRIKQILINLLSNAVKFTENGGRVAVHVSKASQELFQISIQDTGRGIAREHLEHLFEPYYQATISDQGIGTGLGLAIIKHLTELHGGFVQVQSDEGIGSVFTVRLPFKVDEASADPVETAKSVSGDPEPQSLAVADC